MSRFKIFVLFSLLFLSATAWSDAKNVADVKVRGNLRVETAKILNDVETKPGAVYDQDAIQRDLRKLYAYGTFDDVLVEADDNGALTFVVLERPALRNWSLEENDVLEQSDVETLVKLEKVAILKRGDIEAASEAIKGKFREKGYYLADVTPELNVVDSGKNLVDVMFKVGTGSKVTIRHINLPGVPDQTLGKVKDGMSTTERGSWSWLSNSGTYKEADLRRDADWIAFYHMERGYADISVGKPLSQVSADLNSVEITIPVSPGPIYYIDQVTAEGDEEHSGEELVKISKLQTGELFDIKKIQKAVADVEDVYADQGYAFARVIPQTNKRPEDNKLDLRLVVDKGQKYKIGKIEANGNTRTRDRVIRREMALTEGELYKRSLIRKSERNLKRLAFFENVNITPAKRPGTDQVDLNVSVAEKSTGNFTIGAGYSSYDHVFAMGSITESNFLGYGYQLSADANVSSSRQTYSVNFVNPRLFDTNVYTGYKIYNSHSEFSEYDKDAIGGSVRVGTQFLDDWFVRASYSIEDAKYSNVCTDEEYAAGRCTRRASILVQDQVGKSLTSSITPMIGYDSRDNVMLPTEGNYSTYTLDWAGGLLGGDNNYLKHLVEFKQFQSSFYDTVFMVRARGGYIQGIGGKDVPVDERFALGGISSVRGYDYRSIGPKDPGSVDPLTGALVSTDEVIGGNKYSILTAEFLFPLIKEAQLNGVVFFDAGNAWLEGQDYFSSPLVKSTGAGIRWFSPMGPIRLEYAYKLDAENNDDKTDWEFSIGTGF